MFKITKKYTAFTLAEVLIVVGIIGIIAEFTIPNLIVNYQKEQTATQLKKAYSEISQVFLSSTAENGFPQTWDWGTTYTEDANTKFIETYILPHFFVVQNCGFNTTGSCTRGKKYYLNKSVSDFPGYQIKLKDGTVLNIWLDGNSSGGMPPNLLEFFIDLNGEKPPNTWGKDIFIIIFKKNISNTMFFGYESNRDTLKTNSTWGCNKSSSSYKAGIYCGALIMYDGWQIKDDYPW